MQAPSNLRNLFTSVPVAAIILAVGQPAWSQTLTFVRNPGEVGTSVPTISVDLNDNNTILDEPIVDVEVIWDEMKHVEVDINLEEGEQFNTLWNLFFECFPLGSECFAETDGAEQLQPDNLESNFLDENGEPIPFPIAFITICDYNTTSALCNVISLVFPSEPLIFHGVQAQIDHSDFFLGGDFLLTEQPPGDGSLLGDASLLFLSEITGENDQYTIGQKEAKGVPEPTSILSLLILGGTLLGFVPNKVK